MDYPTYSFGEHNSVAHFNAPNQYISPLYLSRVPSDENLDIPDEGAQINNIGYDILQGTKEQSDSSQPTQLPERSNSHTSDTNYAKAGKVKINLTTLSDVISPQLQPIEFSQPVCLNLTQKLENVNIPNSRSETEHSGVLCEENFNRGLKSDKSALNLKLELNDLTKQIDKNKASKPKPDTQVNNKIPPPVKQQKQKASQNSTSNKENATNKKPEAKNFLKKGHSRNASATSVSSKQVSSIASSAGKPKILEEPKKCDLKINTEAVNNEFDDSKQNVSMTPEHENQFRMLRKDEEKSNLLPDVSLVMQTLSDEPIFNDLKIKSYIPENPKSQGILGKIPLQIGSIQVGEDLIDDNIKINPEKSQDNYPKTPNQNLNDSGKKFLFKFPLSKTPSNATSPNYAEFFKTLTKKEEEDQDNSISNISKLKGTITKSEIKNKRFLSMTMTDFLDKSFNNPQNTSSQNLLKSSHKSSKSLLPREEKELAFCTYHPQITTKARKIIAQKESDPNYQKEVHHRLYSYSQKKTLERDRSAPHLNNLTSPTNLNASNTFDITVTSKTIKGYLNDSFTFHPTIQKKSKMLQREGRVEDILYNEAKRRQKESVERKSMNKKEITRYTLNKSDQYVAKRLIKEFDELAEVFFAGEKEHKFNYMQMCEFLKQLNFIKSGENNNTQYYVKERSLLYDIWTILRGDKYNGVNERNLLVFLLAVMGLNFEIPTYNKPDVTQSLPVVEPACLNKAEILKADTSSRSSPRKGSNHPSVQNRAETEPRECECDHGLKRDESKRAFTLPQSRGSLVENEKNSVVINLHEMNDGDHNILINKESKQPIGTVDQNENIKFNAFEIQSIKKVYDVFYLNRLYFTNISAKIAKDTISSSSTHSFHPEILSNSKNLAVNYREKQLERAAKIIAEKELTPPPNGRITHADLLIYQKIAWDHKAENEKKKNELRELESCTFKPRTLDYKPIVIDLNDNLPAQLEKTKSGQLEHRGERLYQQAKLSNKQRVDKTSEEMHFEKNVAHLTFHPDIKKSQKSQSNVRRQSNEPIKNADKAMQRMVKGRERVEEKKKILEKYLYKENDDKVPAFRFSLEKKDISVISVSKPTPKNSRKESGTANNTTNETSFVKSEKPVEEAPAETSFVKKNPILLPRLPINETSDRDDGSNYHVPKATQDERYEDKDNVNELLKNYEEVFDKTSELQKKIIEKIPLLFVDVNFGPGKSQRIIVYEGDTAEELADKFANEHGLDENMRFKLRVLLESHMSGILSKIEEERPSTQSDQDKYTSAQRTFTDSK